MKRKLKIEIGLAVLLLLIALFGSFLAPYDPLKVNYDFPYNHQVYYIFLVQIN